MKMNLPNQITVARLILSIVFFILLACFDWDKRTEQWWVLDATFAIFVVAAVSDILDGYLARKHNQVTAFGRILDPFVDKILVTGAFVLLLGAGFCDGRGRNVADLAAWMVVVILAREFLVTGLRGFTEARGQAYAANVWGKTKMVVQSVTVGWILLSLGRLDGIVWVAQGRTLMIWMTVGITALSAVAYISKSREALMDQSR